MPALPPREVGKVSAVGNLTASGAIGVASLVTDVRAVALTQTTANLTFTLPAPTDVAPVFGLDVVNTGTASFVMYLQSVLPGATLRCIWNGSGWVVPMAVDPPSYTVANLPTTGNVVGQLAFATNGRALTGVAGLSAGFATQAAGAGTGCLVSWNGTAWQIVGTTSTVTA